MVTIDDIRKHCNVDFDDDDSYISGLIKVAEVAVANVINTPLDTYVITEENYEAFKEDQKNKWEQESISFDEMLSNIQEYRNEVGKTPEPLDHAVKLIVANLYENREPVSYGKATNVAFTLGFLLSPYIVLT